MTFIIAIDGPAGAGKGTLSESLAAYYDLAYLDTGSVYRYLALQALEKNISLEDEEKLASFASSLSFENLKKTDLRKPEIGNIASEIASLGQVRQALIQFQKNFAAHPPAPFKGAILDGRDIGTVICPHASIKIFLQADIEMRAQRRFKELQNQEIQSIYRNVLQEMLARDQRDRERTQSPLQIAEDAYVIDSTSLTAQEVLDKAIAFIEMHPR